MSQAMHYELTLNEHRALTNSYVDPDRYRRGHRDYRPEMLCRNGSAHAAGTRLKSRVTCEACKERLAHV